MFPLGRNDEIDAAEGKSEFAHGRDTRLLDRAWQRDKRRLERRHHIRSPIIESRDCESRRMATQRSSMQVTRSSQAFSTMR